MKKFLARFGLILTIVLFMLATTWAAFAFVTFSWHTLFDAVYDGGSTLPWSFYSGYGYNSLVMDKPINECPSGLHATGWGCFYSTTGNAVEGSYAISVDDSSVGYTMFPLVAYEAVWNAQVDTDVVYPNVVGLMGAWDANEDYVFRLELTRLDSGSNTHYLRLVCRQLDDTWVGTQWLELWKNGTQSEGLVTVKWELPYREYGIQDILGNCKLNVRNMDNLNQARASNAHLGMQNLNQSMGGGHISLGVYGVQAGQSATHWVDNFTAKYLAPNPDSMTSTPGTITPSPTTDPGFYHADGFESGDFGGWTRADSSGSASLSVLTTECPAGVLAGIYCMKSDVDVTLGAGYVTDETPNNETFYTASFSAKVTTTSTSSNPMKIMYGKSSDGTNSFALQVYDVVGTLVNKSRLVCFRNDGTTIATPWMDIPTKGATGYNTARFTVTVSSSASGWCSLLLEDLDPGDPAGAETVNLNNSTKTIDSIQLGIPSIPTGKSGQVFLDYFISDDNQ